MPIDFALSRNTFGALVFEKDGITTTGAVPVRAFPISAPQSGISLLTPQGHELLWIEDLADLPGDFQRLLKEELENREFMPEICRLLEVSSFATPCTWQVETDRGNFAFILRGEENIRRLAQGALLISDSHGIHFLIRDPAVLDRNSRKLLDRFL